MRVTVVGLGGIGKYLADFVARYLHWNEPKSHTLTVVDGKAYEQRKAERQPFASLGPKAQVTATELGRQYPSLCIESMAEFVQPDNADFILLEDEIVLLAVDNHATRKFVSDVCGQRDTISLISGGNEIELGTVQVYLRRKGVDATPSLTEDHPEIETPAGKAPHLLSCEELAQAGSPQVLFANLTAAVLMANAFWRLVTKPDGFVTDERGTDIKVETAYSETHFDIYRNLVHSRRHPTKK